MWPCRVVTGLSILSKITARADSTPQPRAELALVPTLQDVYYTRIKFDEAKGFLASKAISPGIGAISIEFCYIKDYLGDVEQPNRLSLALLQNLEDIGGRPPNIRIGGHTQDVARFNKSQPETLCNVFEQGNDEAVNVTFNSNLFKVLNENVPQNQTYTFGINFGQDNVSIPIEEIVAAEKYLEPERLYAYELGNEPDFYSTQRSGEAWDVLAYATQQASWYQQLIPNIKDPSHGSQMGAFAQSPMYMGNFSLATAAKLGLPAYLGDVKTFSDHTYPFSMCDEERAAMVSLPALMNHLSTVQLLAQWTPEITATEDAGAAFVMGETGSVSCHGKDGVSNTLGAALWEIDYMLHGATLGMQAIYFHMGTMFYYSFWQPVPYNGTSPRVYPTYYSLLFVATLIAKTPEPTVLELDAFENNQLAFYAIYGAGKLEKIVVLNLEFHNLTLPPGPPYTVDVSGMLGRSIQVSRLIGSTSDVTDSAEVTWSGQSFANGTASGSKVSERYENGTIVIGATEAIIIERQVN